MPILWAETAEIAQGVIGEAMARAEAAQQDLVSLIGAVGATIVGGIAYFIGQLPWSPPALGSCYAYPATALVGGGRDDDFSDSPDDVFDLNWVEAFDNQQTGDGKYQY